MSLNIYVIRIALLTLYTYILNHECGDIQYLKMARFSINGSFGRNQIFYLRAAKYLQSYRPCVWYTPTFGCFGFEYFYS